MTQKGQARNLPLGLEPAALGGGDSPDPAGPEPAARDSLARSSGAQLEAERRESPGRRRFPSCQAGNEVAKPEPKGPGGLARLQGGLRVPLGRVAGAD